jgi:hypothetical protein
MANSKISALTSATTPLAGTETLPVVQSSTTKQVSVANLTAGRAVSAASLALTTSPLPVSSGGTGATSFTTGQVLFGSFSQSSSLFWDNTNKYLGIGTSSPAAGVEVSTADLTTIFATNPTTTGATTGSGIGFKVYNGSTVAQNGSIISTSSTWSFGTYTANQLSISADGSGGVRVASATAPISFYTGGAYSGISSLKMQLSSSGFLGLGCTPGAIGGDLDIIANQNGIGIGYSTLLYRRIIPQATNVLSFASAANTATLSAAGAWTNASDARLKKNITNIKYGLNTVMAAQPRSYNRKDVPGEFIGFVAQELKTLVPEVVFGNDDEQYTVDYGSLVAIAFKAIQELKAEIEILKGGK